MCQAAWDPAVRMADRFKLPGPAETRRGTAGEIQEAFLVEAWDLTMQSPRQHLRSEGLDASLLPLLLPEVATAGHPKLVATSRAVIEQLGAGQGLLYPYMREASPDGLTGHFSLHTSAAFPSMNLFFISRSWAVHLPGVE